MGSIPTHSRHLLAVCAACLAVGVAVPAHAQDGKPVPGPGPLNRAMRSVVFPAWGQVTNGREVKAALLFTVETYVWTRAIMETRKGRESRRRLDSLETQGAGALEIARAEAAADEHFTRRRDMLFWGIFAGLYGALDAYVDANLGDIDEEIEDGKGLFAGVDPVTGSMQVGIHF